jgi:hypothetical protein
MNKAASTTMAEQPVMEPQKGGMIFVTTKNMFGPSFRVEENLNGDADAQVRKHRNAVRPAWP